MKTNYKVFIKVLLFLSLCQFCNILLGNNYFLNNDLYSKSRDSCAEWVSLFCSVPDTQRVHREYLFEDKSWWRDYYNGIDIKAINNTNEELELEYNDGCCHPFFHNLILDSSNTLILNPGGVLGGMPVDDKRILLAPNDTANFITIWLDPMMTPKLMKKEIEYNKEYQLYLEYKKHTISIRKNGVSHSCTDDFRIDTVKIFLKPIGKWKSKNKNNPTDI